MTENTPETSLSLVDAAAFFPVSLQRLHSHKAIAFIHPESASALGLKFNDWICLTGQVKEPVSSTVLIWRALN